MANVTALVAHHGHSVEGRHLRLASQQDVQLAQQARQQQWEAMKAGYPTPVRLTRRGRRLVAMMALLPMAVFLWFNSSHGAAAADHSPATRTVVVQPGQTLWDVAVATKPGNDPRQTVFELKKVNHLTSSDVWPGQAIVVPAGN